MAVIERSALLSFSTQQMFRLVGDVEAYPLFLPGCTSAHIELAEGERVRVRLGFRIKGLSDSFATENRLQQDNSIQMRLVEGPFRKLAGAWEFLPLGECACKVKLSLTLDFGNRMLEGTLGPWVDRAVNGVMDAFRLRAEALYGAG